jgi:hypothetical protein
MELRLRWGALSRRTDLAAAAVAGFAAAAALMVLELLWAAVTSLGDPWMVSRSIAAMVLGQDVLRATEFSAMVVAIALVIHYLLGIIFGLAVAAVLSPHVGEWGLREALAAGAFLGVGLYVLSFHLMTFVFPWFIDLRGGAAFTAHVLFGMATAGLYHRFERTSG